MQKIFVITGSLKRRQRTGGFYLTLFILRKPAGVLICRQSVKENCLTTIIKFYNSFWIKAPGD